MQSRCLLVNDVSGVRSVVSEAQAARPLDRDRVVGAARSAGDEEQVVGSDRGDGARRSGGVVHHRNVALAVPAELLDRVAVCRGHTGSGVEDHDPLLEDAEATGVVEVQKVCSGDVRGEDVGDGSCGAIALSVKNQVEEAHGRRLGGGGARNEIGKAPQLDAFDVSDTPVSGRFSISLWD